MDRLQPLSPATTPVRSSLPATSAVRSGLCSDLHHGSVVPPIHLSSNV